MVSNSMKILKNVADNVEKVIIGKRDVIELILISIICKGHVLIEDVPGVGKTALVSALAKSIAADFKRVQFTPDVLPSDITGFSMLNQKNHEFEYRSGAIMCNILLADEINRASPKTQSSLLEAMEENQVTVDGVTHKIPQPFFVLATQNPVEYLGTHPLPEAQMDRFLMKVTIGYPDAAQESEIIGRYRKENPLKTLTEMAQVEDIIKIQDEVTDIYVHPDITDYIVKIIRASREHEMVVLGGSPRASIYLNRASQALALVRGRDFVTPDDVKALLIPVLGHRISMKHQAKHKDITSADVISEILKSTPVPVMKNDRK